MKNMQPPIKSSFLFVILFLLLSGAYCLGAEFYVGLNGDDTADGLTPETAWKSIQRGVDELNPGDTLILLPGEYTEQIKIGKSGSPDQPITIRAAIPGFSVLSGWEKVSGFKPVKGHRFVYGLRVSDPVYSVSERETMTNFLFAPSLEEMDRFRGTFHYDPEDKMLYVHSSDGESPDTHSTWASVVGGEGIIVQGSNVHIEGLVIAGFQPRNRQRISGYGIVLKGEAGRVKDCWFFFNAGAVKIEAEYCVVKGNYALMNVNMTDNELAQIYAAGRRAGSARVINNTVLEGQIHGIRFYSSAADATAIGNLIKNTYIGLYYKTSPGVRVVENNVVVGSSYFNWHTGDFPGPMKENYNTFQKPSFWQTKEQDKPGENTLLFDDEEEVHFCAPKHNDYRLQMDSPARGKGPGGSDLGAYAYDGEVLFVSPDGDDENPGQSVARPYLTLEKALQAAKPGTVCYLLPGVYEAADVIDVRGEKKKPIILRSRDPDEQAVIIPSGKGDRPWGIQGASHLKIETLTIKNGVEILDSTGITLDRCLIADAPEHAIIVRDSDSVWIRRSTLWNSDQSPILIAGDCQSLRVTSSILNGGGDALIETENVLPAEIFTEYNGYDVRLDQFLFRKRQKPFVKAATLSELQKLLGNDHYSIMDKPIFMGEDLFALAGGSPFVGTGEISGNIGVTRTPRLVKEPVIEGVRVHQLTPTAVSIAWLTPLTSNFGIRTPQQWFVDLPITSEVRFGKDPENLKRVPSFGDIFHHVSLRNLEPDTTYYYQVVIPEQVGYESYQNEYPQTGYTPEEWRGKTGETKTFKTPSLESWQPSSRTIYVSPEGGVDSDGSSPEDPTSLTAAGDRVQAGDTILLQDGVYASTFDPVATGVPGAPITLRAIHPGKVIMDGTDYLRPSAVVMSWKDQMIIDGLITRRFGGLAYGARAGYQDAQIYLPRCGKVDIMNCVFTGYTSHYTKAVIPRNTDTLIMRNNAFLGFPTSVTGKVEELADFSGNTWYVPIIRTVALVGPISSTNNLFFGQHPQKVGTTAAVQNSKPMRSDYNAYYFGPANTRGYIGFGLENNPEYPTRLATVQKELGLEKNGLELNNPEEMEFEGPLPIDYYDLKKFRTFTDEIASGMGRVPTLEWFALPEGNRLNTAGEKGEPIGARPILSH